MQRRQMSGSVHIPQDIIDGDGMLKQAGSSGSEPVYVTASADCARMAARTISILPMCQFFALASAFMALIDFIIFSLFVLNSR